MTQHLLLPSVSFPSPPAAEVWVNCKCYLYLKGPFALWQKAKLSVYLRQWLVVICGKTAGTLSVLAVMFSKVRHSDRSTCPSLGRYWSCLWTAELTLREKLISGGLWHRVRFSTPVLPAQLCLLPAPWDTLHMESLWASLASVPVKLFAYPAALGDMNCAHKPCLFHVLLCPAIYQYYRIASPRTTKEIQFEPNAVLSNGVL